MSRAEKLRDGKEIQEAVTRLPVRPSHEDLVRLAEVIAAVSIKRPVPGPVHQPLRSPAPQRTTAEAKARRSP